MKQKPYSRLSVRERIAHDIEYYQNRIEDLSGADDDIFEDRIEELKKYKEILEDQAHHYDDEVKKGYKNPSRWRWKKDK